MIKLFLLSIILIVIPGCSKDFNSVEEYREYVNGENYPYARTIIKNGVKVTVRYMPSQALMIPVYQSFVENKSKWQMDTTLFKDQIEKKIMAEQKRLTERRAIYDRSIYFTLTIGYEDESKDIVYQRLADGSGTYTEWLQKLLFGLKEYIYLRTAKVEEAPIDTYHMERSFGMTKYRKILLAFPDNFNEIQLREKDNEKLEIIIREFGLKAGRMKFAFDLPINVSELGVVH